MQRTVATAELPQHFVVFAIPCLSRHVAFETFQSAVQTEWLLGKEKVSSAYRFVTGDQFIAKARNRLVIDFLTDFPAATDFFFIDDDIGYPAEKVLEFIRRPEAVICGVYPKKKDEPDWPCTLEAKEGKFVQNEDGLYSAILAPTGFMRIKRWMVEALVNGRRLYEEDNGDGTMGLRYNLFEAGLLPHWEKWSGEDYDICQKIRELGEKIWVDTDITFSHRGTHRWEGNMCAYMKANAADIEKKIADATAKLEEDITPKPLMPIPSAA